MPSGARIAVLGGIEKMVADLAWSPDGAVLAAAAHQGGRTTIRLWYLDGARSVAARTLEVGLVGTPALAFSADSGTLTAFVDGELVQQWRASDGTPTRTLSLPVDYDGRLCGGVVTGDASVIAAHKCNEEGVIRLLRIADGVEVGRLRGHRDTRNGMHLAMGPTGDYLASWAGHSHLANSNSGSPDSTLRLWRISDGQRRTLHGKDARGPLALVIYDTLAVDVAFSADGNLLVAALDDGTLAWWAVR